LYSGFCGLVPVGVFGFSPVFGLCRFFFFSLSLSCFDVLLYTSCMLRCAFSLFIYFLYLPIKKKEKKLFIVDLLLSTFTEITYLYLLIFFFCFLEVSLFVDCMLQKAQNS
jgi:hypothetical protein